MEDYHFEGFGFAPLVEKYSGKKVEELFQDHEIIKNDLGEFMAIIWKANDLLQDLKLLKTRKKVLCNLKAVHYIGEHIERQLFERGIKNLKDLRFNLKYSKSATKILKLINKKDYKILSKNRYIRDLDLLFCFSNEDLLFLDIETLGSYESPIIIIGIGFFKNDTFEIKLFFARDLEEEIAIFEHFKNEILPNFKCFITYNGKSFDIPNIANRFLYFFEENPMISDEDNVHEKRNTRFHHVDLYHNCRRKYKGQFENYKLSNIEKELLECERDSDIPGHLIGEWYKLYLKNPERYIGLIKEIIEHNFNDVLSMPLILERLLEDI